MHTVIKAWNMVAKIVIGMSSVYYTVPLEDILTV